MRPPNPTLGKANMPTVVLISGEIAAGKTTVCQLLVNDYAFARVGTGSFLQNVAAKRGIIDRDALKNIGDTLDIETQGRWVFDLFVEEEARRPNHALWLVDSVRRDFQIPWFTARFASTLHVHLTVSEDVARERYESRRKAGGDYSKQTSFEEAKAGPTEQQVATLGPISNLCISMDASSPANAAAMVADFLRQNNLMGAMHDNGCSAIRQDV